MSLFAHFDGQYRSRPRVSLRGASKEEAKDTLIQRVRQEREQRESARRRNIAALTIQATFRGHRVREKQYDVLRVQFDSCATSGTATTTAMILNLSRLLVVFYREKNDHSRLIQLCQKWLQSKTTLAPEACTNSICAFHLSRILLLSTRSLSLSPDQPLAVPLRMLEVFLSSLTYRGIAEEEASSRLLDRLTKTLVHNGYFKSLRTVLETRVPSPDGPDSTHSALADSILVYLTQPLLRANDERYLKRFMKEMFCNTLTSHILYLLLPHLSRSHLSVTTLISVLRLALSSNSIPPSLSLLFAVLQLTHGKLDKLEVISQPEVISSYCHILSQLLSKQSTHSAQFNDENEEFVNEWDGLDEEAEFDPLESSMELLGSCLSMIVSDKTLPLYLCRLTSFSEELLVSLCGLCHQLLVVRVPGVSPARFLQQLSVSPTLLLPLWSTITKITVEGFSGSIPGLQFMARGGQLQSREATALVERLGTFSSLFSLYLSTLHDAEFYGETSSSPLPFTHDQLIKMVAVLRDVYVSLQMEKHLSYSLSRASSRLAEMRPSPAEYLQLKQSVYQLLCGLHERDSRRPFCPPRHWEGPNLSKITAPPDLFLEADEEEGGVYPRVAPSVTRSAELLKRAPFVFPFEERVRFFRSLVAQSKKSIRGNLQEFLIGPALHVTARRNHIYEDAFSELSQGKDLRLPLKVMLVNAQGLDEPGIDGGGLFREFLSELLKTGFDPNHGYFTSTQEGQLYPNPQAPFLSDNYVSHYRFLGAMLGKALYEHLLVEIPFAGFFLCKLTDRGQGRLEAYHLASLDPELYRNVLSLKHYEGNVEDLDLNFTTISSEFGQSKVIELRPGGADIQVTKENCIQYIHLLANWRLNTSIDRQFRAFREGLANVVPLAWLRLFNQRELQVLISGAEVPIDINDLRTNTKYAGEYKEDHEAIHMFWEVVEGFNEQEKQQLLKFVTSCSRPPLLGFKDLFPPFCIMSGGQDDRLPSASTCMNLLKLPVFPDFETLKSRLKYALSSGAGFELS